MAENKGAAEMLIRIWSSSFGGLLSFINIELEFQQKAWRSKEFLFHMQQTLESADVLKEKSKKEQNQRREEGKRDLRVMWEAAWRRAVVSILMWHQQNDSSSAESVAAGEQAEALHTSTAPEDAGGTQTRNRCWVSPRCSDQ